jgi:hypothetical protein
VQFALECAGMIALEEIVENFRLTDIRHRNDLQIIAFRRELIEVSADLA